MVKKKNVFQYTEKKLIKSGFSFRNELLKSINLSVNGHCYDIVLLSFQLSRCSIFPNCDNTLNVGLIIQYLIKFFEIDCENGVDPFVALSDIPIRLGEFEMKDGSYSQTKYAMGHFMEDKFILIDDLMKL